jgi:hypothetical protein
MIARQGVLTPAGSRFVPSAAPFVDKTPDTPLRLPGCVHGPWHRLGMTSSVVVRFCSSCQDDVLFEQPDCVDGHDLDCPEWVCVQCGDALLIDFPLPGPAAAVHPASHVA